MSMQLNDIDADADFVCNVCTCIRTAIEDHILTPRSLDLRYGIYKDKEMQHCRGRIRTPSLLQDSGVSNT